MLYLSAKVIVSGKRKRGRPKKTWKRRQKKIGLKKEDAMRREWRDGVRAIAKEMG